MINALYTNCCYILSAFRIPFYLKSLRKIYAIIYLFLAFWFLFRNPIIRNSGAKKNSWISVK